MRRCAARAAGWLALALAVGCAPTTPSPTVPPPTVTPTPAVGGEAQLRSALVMDDKLARRDATLAAFAVYLTDDAIASLDDESASQALTDLAFSTGRLVLPDPILLRRAPDDPRLAVVGLPDGMGLALYDLREQGRQPLLLTPWTAGLQQVYVTWGEGEVGVNYLTVGNDDQSRAHFLLALRDEDADQGWRVTWYSDELQYWWLNGFRGQLEVAPDLSSLTLAGQSDGTTLTFDEAASGVQRTFQTRWERDGSGYTLAPDPAEFESHQAWLWAVAQPAPYATLVEFLERLREDDSAGASRLATSSVNALTAVELGLALPPRRYTVLEQTENAIIFGDEDGTYEAAFIPPARDGEKWLVGDLRSLLVEDLPQLDFDG